MTACIQDATSYLGKAIGICRAFGVRLKVPGYALIILSPSDLPTPFTSLGAQTLGMAGNDERKGEARELVQKVRPNRKYAP